MSKPRISLQATVDTLDHAQTIKQYVTDELVGKDVFEIHNLSAYEDTDIGGGILVSFDIRFNQQVDRDAIRDWIKDQVQNHPIVKTWVTSARVITHRCTHDDAVVQPCTETEYVLWEK